MRTRRELLQGSAGAVLVGLGPASAAASAAAHGPLTLKDRQDPLFHGRALAATADGAHVVVAHALRRSVSVIDRRRKRTMVVALHGQPLEVAISPLDHYAAITTAFWDHPGVTLLRLRDAAVRATLIAGEAPHTPAFTHDRRRLLVSGGEQDGYLRVLRGGAFANGPKVALGRVPRGIAIARDDRSAWVALNGEGAVVRVDLERFRVDERIATAPHPDRVALSPDGRRLLVSHGGRDARTVSEIDLRHRSVREHTVGRHPTAVAWAASGRRLVALGGEHAIAVIGGRRRTTVARPHGLAVAGRHAFTVSAVDAALGRVSA